MSTPFKMRGLSPLKADPKKTYKRKRKRMVSKPKIKKIER
jgi:hypothetical protein